MTTRIDLKPGENETYSSCVVAGDYIFTSHQGGGQHSADVGVQSEASFRNLECALGAAGATLDDVVQITLLLRDAEDFQRAEEVFRKVFRNGFPARTTIITDFVSPNILCQIDAVAYKKEST